MRSSKLEEDLQEEIMEKSLGEMAWLVWRVWAWILEVGNEVVARFLPVKGETPMCSEIRVCKWRRVWPKYNAPQHWHVYLYTTRDFRLTWGDGTWKEKN